MFYVYRFLWPLRLKWLGFFYKFLNVCHFDYTAVAGSGKVGSINQVNHTSWVAVVTPTDRPKSVCNRCVIELFVAFFVLSMPFWHFCWWRGFVIGLSQIISFFSWPFYVIYRYYSLGCCTLSNKVMGTILRDLLKPPQRRQGPDPRPNWLLLGTPSALGPELACRLRVA